MKHIRTKIIEYRQKIIKRLLKYGMGVKDIAKIVGLTSERISQIKNGWNVRYSSKKEWAAYHREYRRKNKAKIRKYKRVYNQKWRKENGFHNEINSRKRYPEKDKARRLVHKAVRKGILVKEPCACGKKKTEAHHEDYTKPLKVVWVCRSCHQKLHKRSMDLSPA